VLCVEPNPLLERPEGMSQTLAARWRAVRRTRRTGSSFRSGNIRTQDTPVMEMRYGDVGCSSRPLVKSARSTACWKKRASRTSTC